MMTDPNNLPSSDAPPAAKTPRKPSVRRLRKLLTAHLRAADRGRKLYQQAGDSLDLLLAAGMPVNEPIRLADGRSFRLIDQFAARNTAFSAKKFDRFKVEEIKQPRRPATAKGREAAGA